MNKLAVHMRIANLNVSDDEVRTRALAIQTLLTAWRELDVLGALIKKAGEIAHSLHGNGMPLVELGLEVESAIQKHAPAYVYTERPLDVGICAALAAFEMISSDDEQTDTSSRDMFAATLWSALGYLPPLGETRRDTLRIELLDACRSRCAEAADSAREREEVDDLDEVEDGEEEADEDIEEFKRVAGQAIASLKRNAVLDREELNFLWWVQLHRSRLLKKQLAQIPEEVRLVACALEGAKQLKALPAEVHRDLVLRTLDADPHLDHEQLLDAIGTDREALNSAYGAVDIIRQVPSAFPLLNSLRGMDKLAGDGAKLSRPSSEWATRALLEAAVVQLYQSSLVDS